MSVLLPMNQAPSILSATAYLPSGDFAGLIVDTCEKNYRRGWMTHSPGGNVFQNE